MDGGAEGRTSLFIWIAGINYSSGSGGQGLGVLLLQQRETKKDGRGGKNCHYSESEQAEEKRATVTVEVWH